MKKTLLLVLAAVATLGANAQVRTATSAENLFTWRTVIGHNDLLQQALQRQNAAEPVRPTVKLAYKTPTFYIRPAGVYFLGPDVEFNVPDCHCVGPANTYLYTIAAVPTRNVDWKFSDVDSTSNKVVEKTQKELLLKYAVTPGRYPAPVLTGHAKDNAAEADSVFTITKDSIDYGNGYNAQFYACNFDATVDAPTVPSNLFYINDSTAISNLGQVFGGQVTNIKLRSVSEMFSNGSIPYYLLGGAAHLFSDNKLKAEDLKFTFTNFYLVKNAQGQDSVAQQALDLPTKVTQFEAIGDGGVYYVRFEIPTQPQIKSAAIVLTILPANDQVKFAPMIVPQKDYNERAEGGYAVVNMDFTYRGEQNVDKMLNAAGFKYGNGVLKSWMMGLFMTYDKNTTNGISELPTAPRKLATGIYTLTGRKLNVAPESLQSGCYIINGQKVLVK